MTRLTSGHWAHPPRRRRARDWPIHAVFWGSMAFGLTSIVYSIFNAIQGGYF